jgi:integrase
VVIRIEQGKGGNGRYVMLSPQLLKILRTYWLFARQRRWLFPGRDDKASARTKRLARRLPLSRRA